MIRQIMIMAKMAISALVAVVFAVSCTSDAGDDRQGLSQDIYLTVEVTPLGNYSGERTRSIFQLPDRKCERLTTLRVLIVNQEDIVEANRQVRYDDNGLLIGDNLTFKVKPGKKTIYLFGNEDNMPEPFVSRLDGYNIGSILPDLSGETIGRLSGEPLYSFSADNIAGGLPMSECFEYTVRQALSETDLYQTAKMFVTRTACKFTFNIRKADGYTPVDIEQSIKSICVTGLGMKEYLLPKNTVYDPAKGVESTNDYGGREITAFDLPAADNIPERYVFTLPQEVVVGSLGELGYTYSPAIYFPESKGEILPGTTSDYGFLCSISYDGETYLPFLPLDIKSLPRNTHVVINITVSHAGLLLTVETMPWDTESFEFDFTDNIGIADDGAISFTEGSYALLDKPTGRVVLNDFPQAASGSFHIATPVGTKWDAFLITVTGEQNAIQFQTEDREGNISTSGHISGLVGEKAEFKVVSTSAAGAVARTARLQVVVTMPNGMSVPADLLQGAGYGDGVENIVFVQNPQ